MELKLDEFGDPIGFPFRDRYETLKVIKISSYLFNTFINMKVSEESSVLTKAPLLFLLSVWGERYNT